MASEIAIHLNLSQGEFDLSVNLALPSSGITVVFGRSGSGKTTLLRAVAGLEKSAHGDLTVAGDVWQSQHQFLPAHKRPLGYVFQEASLFEHLTVEQNLQYAAKRTRAAQPLMGEAAQQHIIELLDIQSLMGRYSAQLSGGERQRVAIARALFTQPQLLLLDEPLASLDFSRKQEVLGYLERLRSEIKIPVIYVTHSTEELVRLADYVVVLEQGQVKSQGELQEVLADQKVLADISHEPFSLLRGSVVESLEPGLSCIDAGGITLRLPQQSLIIGDAVRIRLNAKDISIALSKAADSSILNILPCQIEAIESLGDSGRCLVYLLCEKIRLVASVTSVSCQQLKLREGVSVFAQVKAVSLVR